MKNVIKRTLSGAIYVALIVGAILAGNPFFVILTLLLAVLGTIELAKVIMPGSSVVNCVIACITVVQLCLIPATIGQSSCAICPVSGINLTTAGYLLFSCCILVLLIFTLYNKSKDAFSDLAKSVFGIVYIGMPLALLNGLYIANPSNIILILIMFIMIWLNDTGAFCFGSLLGKHRLFERLSPKKSWEGFWGGFGCCIVFGAICCLYWNPTGWNLGIWLAYGAIVSAFATWGDLFESLIKRTMHVKDSGHLIPGHGGILDRIDSLLFVAPATTIFYFIITRMPH